jgi:hypothetical protein
MAIFEMGVEIFNVSCIKAVLEITVTFCSKPRVEVGVMPS